MLAWIFAAQSTTTSSNPFQSVLDFFDSPAWHFVLLMSYFVLVVIWIAGAYWIFKDARRRIDDELIIAVCVLAGVVFGPIGWIVYAIARPPEYLADRRERELDMQMLEQQLSMDAAVPSARRRCATITWCVPPALGGCAHRALAVAGRSTRSGACARTASPDISHAPPAAVYDRV